MCGKFALSAKTKDIEKLQPDLKSKLEINPVRFFSPTQEIAVISNNNELSLDNMHWGLVPTWSKDTKFATKMFNARAETIDEKPSFKGSFKNKRCCIPATSYFEWKSISNSKLKQAYSISMKSKEIFFFAGIWDVCYNISEFPYYSVAIITTSAKNELSEIHDRMPVILDLKSSNLWMNNSTQADELHKILSTDFVNEIIIEKIDNSFFKKDNIELKSNLFD